MKVFPRGFILFISIVSSNFLIIRANESPSVNILMRSFYAFRNEFKKGNKILFDCDELFDNISALYYTSPNVCLEMVYSTDDIVFNEIFFWYLKERIEGKTCIISDFRRGKSQLKYLCRKASKLILEHFTVPFKTLEIMNAHIQTIEWLILLVRKYIAQTKVLINTKEVTSGSEFLLKNRNNLTIWNYALRNFPINSSDCKVNLTSFFLLFDHIMRLSRGTGLEERDKKYFFLFKIYCIQLFKRNFEGLFDANPRNLPALVCYLCENSSVSSLKTDYIYNIFYYFKTYQEHEKLFRDTAKRSLESNLLPDFKNIVDSLSLENVTYSANFIIRIVNSYRIKLIPSLLWKLNALAVLEIKAKADKPTIEIKDANSPAVLLMKF